MNFNLKKCYILSIQPSSNFISTLCNTPIDNVQSNPSLRILLSNNLKWGPHIGAITKRANSTLVFLHRNLRFCPTPSKRNAYLAHVRAVLEYGAIIWNPYLKQDIDKIEQVQRFIARFITGDYTTRTPGSIIEMLHKLDLPPLQERRRQVHLTFFSLKGG